MPGWIFMLLAVDAVMLIASLWLLVTAFRVHVGWGLAMFLPFGALVFAVKHWPVARAPLLTVVVCGGLIGGIIGSQPELLAKIRQAAEAYRQGRIPGHPAAEPPPPSGPREARDLAETETPADGLAPAAAADANAPARAACARHLVEASALYKQLAKERAVLKPGKATAAFNVKAARYQSTLQALNAEQARLAAADRAAADNQEANAALDRLRVLGSAGDYPAFAALFKTCLAEHRQSPVFPQMLILARQTLPRATPEQLAVLVQRQTDAAKADIAAVTRQIQGIVNQTPATVPKPPPGAEVYDYDYHPGAEKPDFNTADLFATREQWLGEYVYIKHVPGIFYRSADCEFNPQTKYFITSRDVPKKRLSDAEYRQVTALYRQLARDEKLLATQPERLAETNRASTELLALNTQLAALPGR